MAANLVPAISLHEVLQSLEARDALQWFTREKQWINEIHQQLCRIPAPTFLEQQRAEWFAAQFRSLGCAAQLDRSGNVIAALKPPGEGPFIAVTAHLDTVLAPRSKEDIAVAPDGKLLGPGVSDNGAGLAALLALAKALKSQSRLPSAWERLLFVANVGEEGEGNLSGMRSLCKSAAPPIETFLVLDGAATDHITVQALGSRRYEVTFTGPGGHSWSDFGVGNPVHALARAISLFSDTKLPQNPRATINVGVIEGGTGINAIPAQARAKFDIRSESNEKMEELVAVLHAAVERAQVIENERATGGKVNSRLKEIGSRPAGRLPENSPLLAALRAVDAHLGIRSRLESASTDANVPLSLGIPAVSIGAGGQGGGAHTQHEWFNPEGRDLGLKRIFLTLCLLVQDAL
ncbi:MAG: peptidase dimerization domain protein [Bryobacterales bacterium]|nr:peptidase dimerization domain protein [Bryobacterales bacterium]